MNARITIIHENISSISPLKGIMKADSFSSDWMRTDRKNTKEFFCMTLNWNNQMGQYFTFRAVELIHWYSAKVCFSVYHFWHIKKTRLRRNCVWMNKYSFCIVLNKSYFQKSRMTALGETDFIQYIQKIFLCCHSFFFLPQEELFLKRAAFESVLIANFKVTKHKTDYYESFKNVQQ